MGKTTELAKLYNSFWGQICPAYQAGHVPGNTEFPYLTYDMVAPQFGGRGIQAINIYSKSRSFTSLWETADKLWQTIPEDGTHLYLPDNMGFIIIRRNTGAFVQSRTLPDEEVSQDIKACYAACEIRSYIL